MIEQVGVGIAFYAFFEASKQGKTGLTVTTNVYRITEAGVSTQVVTGGAATEIGDGLYRYGLSAASVTAAGEYIAVFKTTDSTVDAQHLPAIWTVGHANIEHLDAAISSRNAVAPLDSTATQAAAAAALTAYDPATGAEVAALPDAILDGEEVSTGVTVRQGIAAAGGAADPLTNAVPGSYAQGTAGYILGSINPAQVTIVSPVSSDGMAITVLRGDDYLLTDNRALTFTGSTWPSITGASIALKVNFAGTILSYTGTVTAADSCYVELTDTQTGAMATGTFDYDLEATLSNGSVVTLVQGQALVTPDIR